MLVLSRQRDETVMIGDDIEVTVVDIRGDKVRLGITAPREISVHRKEVYDAIRRENRAAAQVRPEDLTGIGRLAGSSTPQKAAADIKQIDEDNAEKRLIGQVLLRHKGDISAAAASLNITRGDLDRKMEMLKIKVEK